MTKYNNSKIYKIIPNITDDNNEVYIGSTTKKYLSERMASHRDNYKRWKEGKVNKTSSFILFDKYGVENCKIFLIEEIKCNSKDELRAKEAEYIRNHNCINKNIPNRSSIDYYNEKMKDDSFKNKEQQRAKLKYQKNKEKLNEKYKCECGGFYTLINKKKHFDTKKHLSYILE